MLSGGRGGGEGLKLRIFFKNVECTEMKGGWLLGSLGSINSKYKQK